MKNIIRESVTRILHEDLKMRKVSAKMVLKHLTYEYKEKRNNIWSDIMKRFTVDPEFGTVITCHETRVFEYDLETSQK